MLLTRAKFKSEKETEFCAVKSIDTEEVEYTKTTITTYMYRRVWPR